MSDLSIAWRGGSRYTVYSPTEDGDSDAYNVHLDGPTCDCDHGRHQSEDSTAACKHIREAVKAHDSHPDLEYSIIQQYAGLIRDAETAYSKAQKALESASEANVAAREAEAGAVQDSAESGEQTASDDSDDSDGEVETSENTNTAQDEALDRLQEWFEGAAEFNDYDPAIVDLEWAGADGSEGVAVETEPFTAGYYDDGEWQDKEAFDAEKDALMDSVLSAKDEFAWYGEPDYCHFVAKPDVLEMVDGGDE